MRGKKHVGVRHPSFKPIAFLNSGGKERKRERELYLTERGAKNPGALSLEAMKRVRPGGTHFAILRRINSGRVSLSK